MSTLAPFVPAFVRRSVAGGPALAPSWTADLCGAVIVADIAGFTALTERKASAGQAGIEEMQALLNRCFALIVAVIESGGGEVYKFAGDATIACWFSPGDPRSAALAAAATALRLRALVPELEAAAKVPLQLRIGVGAGDLHTAIVGGAGGRWEALLGGHALAQIAGAEAVEPGQVVLSANAFRLLAGDCNGRELPGGAFAIDDVTPPPAHDTDADTDTNDDAANDDAAEAGLLPFVPRHVVGRLRGGRHGGLAELRFASVLFAALPAPTALAGLQAAVERMQASVYRFGGSVAQCLVDDKGKLVVVAAWGIAGSSHSDDTERAVLAARSLHRDLRAAGHAAAVGVASGRLFAGVRGAPSRSEFALIGAAVNRAARLCEAAAGRVWCDEATARAVAAIDFAAQPPAVLKGIGATTAFEPIGARARSGLDAATLVGREREIAALDAALLRAGADPDRRTLVVVVEGEPGIGKSHLGEAFARRLRDGGLVPARGSCEALDSGIAWRSLCSVFSTLLGLDAIADPAERRSRVLGLIGNDPGLVERAGLLAPVLDLAIDDTPTTLAMSGRARIDAVADLLVRLLDATDAGGVRPLLLEDAQWLDSPSWEVLAEAAKRSRGLLLVLLARPLAEVALPPAARGLVGDGDTVRLALAGLGEAALRKIIEVELGSVAVPDALVGVVSDKSQGVPLFVGQVLGALVDRGIVRVESGRVHCNDAALAAFAVPDSIQGAVISRIDRLTPRQQASLKKASVIGPSFSLEALASADAGDVSAAELAADIEAIAERGLVVRGAAGGEFSFSHSLVRDAVYSLMPFERRRELHAAFGAWYERRFGDDAGMLGRIAFHHAEAHDPVRAPAALEKAAQRALRAGACREARLLFAHLLDIADHGFGKDDPVRIAATRDQRAQWQYGLGMASYDSGELTAAQRALESAAALLGAAVPSDRMVHGRLAAEVLRAALRRFWPGSRARRVATAHDRLLARVLMTLSRIYHLTQRRNHTLFTMMTRYNRIAHCDAVAEQMSAIAGVMYLLMMLGRQASADLLAERIQGIYRSLQQPLEYAEASYVVSLSYLFHARWQDCARAAEEAERICARLGERQQRLAVMAVLANAAELRGDLQRSWELSSTLLAAAEASGNQLSTCWAAGGLATVALRQGRVDLARSWAERALQVANSIGESVSQLSNSGLLAILALESGDTARAAELVDDGVAWLDRLPRFATAHHVLYGLDTFSEAILLLWESAAPAHRSDDWKWHARRAALGVARMKGYALTFAIGRPATANRQALQHWLLGRPARAFATWRQAVAEAERLQIPYECGKAHLELARHLPVGSDERARHADAARATFARIGALGAVSRCEALAGPAPFATSPAS